MVSQTLKQQGKPQVVSSIDDYKKIRNQVWLNPAQISHFPTEIPGDARVKGFIYSPISTTGGSALQLRLQKPQPQIKQLLAHYQQIAKAKYYGGNTNEHANRDTPKGSGCCHRGLPTTFFYTDNNDSDDAFPASYQVLVLGAQDQGIEGFAWSHGNSYGVAIDPHASEIVYWAEAW